MHDAIRWIRDRAGVIGTVCLALLAVRFFSGVALAARPPDPGTLAAIGAILRGYEIALPFVLLASLFLHFHSSGSRARSAAWIAVVVLLVVSLGVWPDGPVSGTSGVRRSAFFALAVAATAAGSVLAATLGPGLRTIRAHWWGWAFLALLVLVPAVLAMRLAALAGVGSSPGPGGALQGNWALVHAPTFALELLAIGVWMYPVLAAAPAALRRRWPAFLPFLAVPLAAIAFVAAPLSETILSATISWGANLAVFVPVELSLTLAVFDLACYASAFLLVRPDGDRRGWRLVLLGTLTILLAGFFPSMASVVGLVLGLVTTGRGLALWDRKGG